MDDVEFSVHAIQMDKNNKFLHGPKIPYLSIHKENVSGEIVITISDYWLNGFNKDLVKHHIKSFGLP